MDISEWDAFLFLLNFVTSCQHDHFPSPAVLPTVVIPLLPRVVERVGRDMCSRSSSATDQNWTYECGLDPFSFTRSQFPYLYIGPIGIPGDPL